MGTIADLSPEPRYTIKAVCAQTGIRPVTLRAWERRYGLLAPQRGENKYRRYSEREVALLRWVKSRVDSGMPISSTVDELKRIQAEGLWPEPMITLPPAAGRTTGQEPQAYAQALFLALRERNEAQASEHFQAAKLLFDLTTLCSQVITPCLVEIGEAWARGEILIAGEHFASGFLRGKLLSLFQAYPVHRMSRMILIGSAPGELHEIGSLMLAILLRRDGYRVEYLGPDLPAEDLIEYVRYQRPRLVCLSATLPEAALRLQPIQPQLARMQPAPFFGFGGRAFNQDPALRGTVPGVFLGEDLDRACAQIHQLLDTLSR